jgi:hypothetical protein
LSRFDVALPTGGQGVDRAVRLRSAPTGVAQIRTLGFTCVSAILERVGCQKSAQQL